MFSFALSKAAVSFCIAVLVGVMVGKGGGGGVPAPRYTCLCTARKGLPTACASGGSSRQNHGWPVWVAGMRPPWRSHPRNCNSCGGFPRHCQPDPATASWLPDTVPLCSPAPAMQYLDVWRFTSNQQVSFPLVFILAMSLQGTKGSETKRTSFRTASIRSRMSVSGCAATTSKPSEWAELDSTSTTPSTCTATNVGVAPPSFYHCNQWSLRIAKLQYANKRSPLSKR